MAKNVLSNPGRALDLTAKITTAAVSKNSKQALSTFGIDNNLQYWKRSLPWQICLFLYHLNGAKMERLYPTAPFESKDLEQRLEKKLNDFNTFNSHINNIIEMITYIKDKNHKSKRNIKIIKP